MFNEIIFGQPKYFGFLFCWKPEYFGSGCSEPIFCFLVALLLTPNTITCTVWHVFYLLENSLAKMQTPLNALLSLSHPQKKWDCHSNLWEEKMGKNLTRIIFFAIQYMSNCFFFSLLKRNSIYWDFVLQSHRKWSKCVIFSYFIRNCREKNLVLSVVGEG